MLSAYQSLSCEHIKMTSAKCTSAAQVPYRLYVVGNYGILHVRVNRSKLLDLQPCGTSHWFCSTDMKFQDSVHAPMIRLAGRIPIA